MNNKEYIDTISQFVRNDNYRTVIESNKERYERLVDIGTVDGNDDICVLCFEGHRFALLMIDEYQKINKKRGENVYNFFMDINDDVPEFTITIKQIKGN